MALPDPGVIGMWVGNGQATHILAHGVGEPVRVVMGVRVEQGIAIVLIIQVPLVLADHVVV